MRRMDNRNQKSSLSRVSDIILVNQKNYIIIGGTRTELPASISTVEQYSHHAC